MFGLGGQEILLLLICGAVPLGAVVVVALALSRGSGRQRALEEENRELRRRLDEREARDDRPGPGNDR
jgi:hypothetical protein